MRVIGWKLNKKEMKIRMTIKLQNVRHKMSVLY